MMADMQALLDLMAQLRDSNAGCDWCREQTFASISSYTLEEAFEVADAIAAGDRDALRDELGDLLLQVVFHSRMAEEEGSFGFADVVAAIHGKLVRRHPQLFAGDTDYSANAADWEAIKRAERAARGEVRASRCRWRGAGALADPGTQLPRPHALRPHCRALRLYPVP